MVRQDWIFCTHIISSLGSAIFSRIIYKAHASTSNQYPYLQEIIAKKNNNMHTYYLEPPIYKICTSTNETTHAISNYPRRKSPFRTSHSHFHGCRPLLLTNSVRLHVSSEFDEPKISFKSFIYKQKTFTKTQHLLTKTNSFEN